jgi:hypothetical protein
MSEAEKELLSFTAEFLAFADVSTEVLSTANASLPVSHKDDSLGHWLDIIKQANKIPLLIELEMWLKGLVSFFDIKNQPLGDLGNETLATYNFIEELKLVSNATLRVNYLANRLSNALPSNLTSTPVPPGVAHQLQRFYSYEQTVTLLSSQPYPEDSIALLTESFVDLQTLIDNLIERPHITIQTFMSVGKILRREIERCHYLNLLFIYTFKAQYDRIDNDKIAIVVQKIENDLLRQDLSKAFLGFFRMLRYLEFVAVDLNDDRPLKDSLLIFCLIYSEASLLINFLENRLLKLPNLPSEIFDQLDGCVYALQMELRKVFEHELAGLARFKQASAIYVKVENAHGLLRDTFQQSVSAIAQIFVNDFEGTTVFENFHTRLDQSLRLRSDIWYLLCVLRKFEAKPEGSKREYVMEQMHAFREGSLKHLMYKDWDDFERLAENTQKCRLLDDFVKSVHIFATFLEALLGQINMRTVLANHPFDYPDIADNI